MQHVPALVRIVRAVHTAAEPCRWMLCLSFGLRCEEREENIADHPRETRSLCRSPLFSLNLKPVRKRLMLAEDPPRTARSRRDRAALARIWRSRQMFPF